MPLNFTSRAEIESIFSIEGVDMRLDDLVPSAGDGQVNPTEESYFEDLQHEATDEILSFLAGRYSPSALGAIRRIRRWTSYIACYYLSARRAQPRQFVSRYMEIQERLQKLHDGVMQLYDDNGAPVPLSDNFAPAGSNLVVDDNYGRRKIRVQPTTSTGGASGFQDPDDWPWAGG